ncbi:hypothetical protein D3C71_1661780 [compost metagenome]
MSIAVKMNGVLQYYIDPDTPKEDGSIFRDMLDGLNNFADGFISKEVEWIIKPIGESLKDGFTGLVDLLNAYSPEIITLGIIFCSVGMILSPVIGGTSGKWFGRVLFVALIGSVWRILVL